MNRATIEQTFEHAGLKCAVLALDMGHRCGYVRVPEGHPWHGTHYDDLEGVEVHGGLTYSNLAPSDMEEDNGWWLGFDCAHLGDGRDPALTNPAFASLAWPDGRVWDTEDVAAEARRLAEQIQHAEREVPT